MQHRIELSKTLLIAIKNKTTTADKFQSKVTGITLAYQPVIKSKTVAINAEGRIIMAPKRKYQIL
ncbi:MAG: hypothetical protein ACTHJ5_04880 [Ilyomonas sp.]